MKVLLKSVCALSVMIITTAPVWATTNSTDLTVTGVISAAACTPTFSGGGVVDYGIIGSNSLKETSYNLLPVKELTFSIACEAKTRVAFKPVTARHEVVPNPGQQITNGYAWGPVGMLGYPTPSVTGIGVDQSGGVLGGMGMFIPNEDIVVDGKGGVRVLEDIGNGWNLKGAASPIHQRHSPDQRYSFSIGYADPIPFTNVSGLLKVQVFINKASELDLAQEVDLDGLVTFEMVYL